MEDCWELEDVTFINRVMSILGPNGPVKTNKYL